MVQTAVSTDRAARGVLDVMEPDGTRRFYNVADFLADLRGGTFADQPAPPAEFTHEHTPALGLPVYVPALGVYALISGHSTCDGSRWRLDLVQSAFLARRASMVCAVAVRGYRGGENAAGGAAPSA